jgi:protocatechuate 3,4-dioxygenase beta subunit
MVWRRISNASLILYGNGFLDRKLSVLYLCSTRKKITSNGLTEVNTTEEKEEGQDSSEKRLCTISGRVTYARGAVPLAVVKARLQPATNELAEAGSATTDLAGAYELSNLEPGTYEVTVTPPKDWKYETKPQLIELAAGEAKVVDFGLEKIVLEAILEGRVFDSNGLPAEGARLEGVICGTTAKLESTVTDAEGRFVFRNVTPGNRFFRVMLSGHVGEVRDFTIEEGQKISLDVALKKAAHRIHGVVTNEEGKPLETTVRLYEKNVISQKWETSKEDGGFEFYVKEGEYSILTQAPFYEFAAWNGLVSEDKKVDFRLTRIPERATPGMEA